MDLPSFLWLWKIAAWSMGLSILAYLLLGITGVWMLVQRQQSNSRPQWLQPFHYITGAILVALVLLLLGIGIVGTLGHYGTLGHSGHLPAGLAVVVLVLISASSAVLINTHRSWARSLHIATNIAMFVGLFWVSLTGWEVVQKYLP
jgi:hypothetical protein